MDKNNRRIKKSNEQKWTVFIGRIWIGEVCVVFFVFMCVSLNHDKNYNGYLLSLVGT